jgi:hypothetical protein
MRARDIRAIAFCIITTLMLLVVAFIYTGNYPLAVLLTAAWAAFILTRPRMLRVFRRMRGEADWSGYYRND